MSGQHTPEPLFLLDGARLKLSFSAESCDECGAVEGFRTACYPLDQYADELQGKWVALVPADNDRHLELADLKKQRDELLEACKGLLKANRITAARPPDTVERAERQLDAIRNAVSAAEAAIAIAIASVKGGAK